MTRTYVIAEAASTHEGQLPRALDLIRLAKEIDADAVKFQWVSSAERLCERRGAWDYRDAYRLIEFPTTWFAALTACASSLGIDFLCTAYLPEDLAVVAPHVPKFKIASFEATDLSFIRAHERFHKPVIISTGMMERRPTHTHGDMEVWWLHCVSAYPANVHDANLRVLHTGEFDGFSDHTLHPMTGAFAVAAGAKIVEFHLRHEQTSYQNADYVVSRDPLKAEQYVRNVRLAEVMLGDGIKRAVEAEAPMKKYRVMA